MYSQITVKDIVELPLGYVKVYYDDKVIYDDTSTNPNLLALNLPDNYEGSVPDYDVYDKIEMYLDEIVSVYTVEIVEFHHCIIHIFSVG